VTFQWTDDPRATTDTAAAGGRGTDRRRGFDLRFTLASAAFWIGVPGLWAGLLAWLWLRAT